MMPPVDDLDARLRDAEKRVQQARGAAAGGGGVNGRELGAGLSIAAQLVIGTAVGTALGWALDRWLGTKPWLLVVGLCLGAAAGFLDAIRAAQRMDREAKARREAKAGHEAKAKHEAAGASPPES